MPGSWGSLGPSPGILVRVPRDLPTAPICAAGLVGGYAVAVASGSRPLGGVLLAACGLTCIAIWVRRDGARTAALLTAFGLFAFAASHVLGRLIGAWPAVLLVALVAAAVCWSVSDARHVTA
jgi:hypothetical protein